MVEQKVVFNVAVGPHLGPFRRKVETNETDTTTITLNDLLVCIVFISLHILAVLRSCMHNPLHFIAATAIPLFKFAAPLEG